MKPTSTLRFVERDEPVAWDMKSNVTSVVTKRVLQQLWRSSFIDEPGEWRDVPLVREGDKP